MNNESVLLQHAQRGDAEAFDALVEPMLPRCYRVAYLIARNREDAADALQDALVRAYRALGNITQGRPFYPWFVRIVVNAAVKVSKTRRKTGAIPLPQPTSDESPEDSLLAHEERERLWQSIQALSPEHRAVIVLRYYDELSEREMAEVLGVPPGTVKSRLYHARSAVERHLQSNR